MSNKKRFSFMKTVSPYNRLLPGDYGEFDPVRFCHCCQQVLPLWRFSTLGRWDITDGYYYSSYTCTYCNWEDVTLYRTVIAPASQIKVVTRLPRLHSRLDLAKGFLEIGIRVRLEDYDYWKWWSDFPIRLHFLPFFEFAIDNGFDIKEYEIGEYYEAEN